MKRAVVATLVLLTLSVAGRSVVTAQTGVDVRSSTATIDFPSGIRFDLQAVVPGDVSEVRLAYEIAPDGVRATAPAQCTKGAIVSCSYELLGSQQNIIIPGAEITYAWSVTAGGSTQTTPDQKVVYRDTRFDWKTLTQGNMTLWYYSGSDNAANAILAAGYDSEQKSSALLQTTVDYPVKLFLYRTADELQPAIQANNSEGVVTLGEVVYSDTAMIAADASPEDIARHEVAHVVQRAALKSAYNPPDWVIEGMAVYEQSRPIGGQQDAIESAIRSNQVLSVRSMSSASSGSLSRKVLLFYGEAWSLVKFLVDTYGQQKFGDYFRAIDAGAGDPGALQQVYGFNQDGLENAWRDSVGLPPRSAATPDDSNPGSTGDGTASPSNVNSGDSNTALIVGIIAVTVVIAGSLLAFGFYLARRLR